MTGEGGSGAGGGGPEDPQAALRARAEAREAAGTHPQAAALSPAELDRMMHELRVHQLELEMQNEELRRAQVELGASRARFIDLYDFAPSGYCTLDEAGVVLQANLRLAAMLGVTRSALLGRPFSSFIPKAEQDLFYRHRRLLLESGAPQAFDLQLAKSDGAGLWAHLEASAGRDAAGAAEHRLVLGDVTAQRGTALALRRLAAVVEQTPASVLITSVSGAIEYVNPAFEKLTGFTSAEALGENPRILKSGRQDAAIYHQLWTTLREGRSWRGRLSNRSKRGEVFTVDAVIAPIRDERGEICNFVAVQQDVTHELALQQELAQARKMESLGRLAGGIAHDFNNILAVILFDVEALQGGAEARPESVAELAREIGDAAIRARDLTRQLLAFARKQVFAPVSLDLNAALRGSERLLRRLLGEDVVLLSDLGPALWSVRCDPSQLEQVVLNLALNARDAMPRGGFLTLKTSPLASDDPAALAYGALPPGDYVQLAVSDTGAGLAPEVQARLFEPFFTTKEVGKGTGLGLATVHGIIRQSGGAIRCESDPGKGTTFFLCLPRAEEQPAQAAAPAAPAKTTRGAESLLLVEDDPHVRRAAVRALEAGGYRVTAAKDGLTALALSGPGRSPFALVVTDVVMPGLDGGALVEELRLRHPGLPALFVSGYSDDALSDHGVLRAGVEFLPKPFTGADLLARVRKLLDKE